MTTPTKLTLANLPELAGRVPVPTYDRSAVTAGIVHIGVGGFHRSHEAYYTDALMNQTDARTWGICGVGLREADREMADTLKAQDYLYTLMVKHPDGTIDVRVIGSIIDFMLSRDDPAAVIDKLAHEDTRIVSLTITEGGYNIDSATGKFMFDNPDVGYDLSHPDSPRLVYGYLTAALKKRRAAGLPPFTVQSCDNIQHNGDVARKGVLAFAEKQDPELAEWISANVRFPNAMVDRITPVTTTPDRERLLSEFGIEDAWPVVCEPFSQWVIEDSFSNGRPAWEEVGAQFVPDVTPYEKMKIRLLNAGHSVLGLLGSLHGFDSVDEAVADPLFARYLRAFMDVEATPVVGEVEGIDLEAYKDSLFERFRNPNMKDSLARICLDSSSKLPKFLIPTINENLAAGGGIDYSALVIAAWCYSSDKGHNRRGIKLDFVDEMRYELHDAAKATDYDVLSFLRLEPIFGDLVDNDRFTTAYSAMIKALHLDPDIAKLMKRVLGD